MPSTSFDTFFACTIIVMAVLIATAFLATTLQARIEGTEDASKDAYLKSIADRLVTHAGSPTDWGKSAVIPTDMGLATDSSTALYQLDIDKISRLSSQNINTLSYTDLLSAAQLSSISLGISVQQVMTLSIKGSNTYTVGSETYATLDVSTSINSKAYSATLQCYVIADNYFLNSSGVTADSGSGTMSVHVPTSLVDDALVVVFARASCDERITSFAVYNLAQSKQEATPISRSLSLSPQNYNLGFESSGINVENVYVLTYAYTSNVTSIESSSCAIPNLIDHSPYVLVACGAEGVNYIQEWTSYPQVPVSAGSGFVNSERNVFGYLVNIDGVLYHLEICLGDVDS